MPDDNTPRETDAVQPFFLEKTGIRGRILRLEATIDAVLNRHDYPAPAARLLGELMVLAGLLAALLKFEGTFTLQGKGNGPVSTLVADVTSGGVIRGYLKSNPAALDHLINARDHPPTPADLTGTGYLAFTVDQPGADRYQAIVALDGETLADSLRNYFRQSDQIESGLVVAVDRIDGEQGQKIWRAGGLVVQRIPDDGGTHSTPQKEPQDRHEDGTRTEDGAQTEDWARTMVLLSSCTPGELLDPDLPLNDLLFRLFHDEGVRVFDRRFLEDGCRCTREKLESVIRTIPLHDIDRHKVDGRLLASCEFCNRAYSFNDTDITAIHARRE